LLSPDDPSAVRPYQRHGVKWLVRQLQSDMRAVLLCDDPGLGKTLQTLLAADALGVQRMLVVSPAGARRVWRAEIQRWFPAWAHRIVILEPGNYAPLRDVDRPDAIVLVAYDTLGNTGTHWAASLTARSWDLLVIDEAHFLKNQSHRTRALYGEKGSHAGLQAKATRVILLTGTPTPNHAGELYQHCRALWPDVLRRPLEPAALMSEAEFQDRFTVYKTTRWGRQVTGSSNTAMLRARMRPHVLHRSKATVLPELPPLVTQDIPLARAASVIDSQLSPSSRHYAQRLGGLNDDELLAQLQAVSPEDKLPLASLRRQLGELKIEAAVDWILERLDCGTRKILVFAWHTHVCHHLARRLAEYEPVTITGDTASATREIAIHRFQTRASTRVFVGQMIAAGTAITLTAASEVAIVEPSWVPGDNLQAIGRAHRLGQHDSVLASFLYLPGTLDQRIMHIFRRKARETKTLFGEDFDDDADADTDTDCHPGVQDRSRAIGGAVRPTARVV
jgi:SWI/SNF-related matrix-associated actin-dependent regulator of chromatin subfamily A-like protein 1